MCLHKKAKLLLVTIRVSPMNDDTDLPMFPTPLHLYVSLDVLVIAQVVGTAHDIAHIHISYLTRLTYLSHELHCNAEIKLYHGLMD